MREAAGGGRRRQTHLTHTGLDPNPARAAASAAGFAAESTAPASAAATSTIASATAATATAAAAVSSPAAAAPSVAMEEDPALRQMRLELKMYSRVREAHFEHMCHGHGLIMGELTSRFPHHAICFEFQPHLPEGRVFPDSNLAGLLLAGRNGDSGASFPCYAPTPPCPSAAATHSLLARREWRGLARPVGLGTVFVKSMTEADNRVAMLTVVGEATDRKGVACAGTVTEGRRPTAARWGSSVESASHISFQGQEPGFNLSMNGKSGGYDDDRLSGRIGSNYRGSRLSHCSVSPPCTRPVVSRLSEQAPG